MHPWLGQEGDEAIATPLDVIISARAVAAQAAARRVRQPSRSLAARTVSTARPTCCHMTSSGRICSISTAASESRARWATAARSAGSAPARAIR